MKKCGTTKERKADNFKVIKGFSRFLGFFQKSKCRETSEIEGQGETSSKGSSFGHEPKSHLFNRESETFKCNPMAERLCVSFAYQHFSL